MAESAAFSRRGHSGAARTTTLTSGITSGATTMDLADASTWTGCDDNGPFRITITDGTTEEEVEATTVSGNTISGMTRGVGGTSATAWSAGASAKHTSSVRDLAEANYAVAETVGKITASGQILLSDAANSFDAVDLDERIRDTTATALVAAGIAVETVDDPGDTITLTVNIPNVWLPAHAFGVALNTPTNALVASGYGSGWSFPDAAQHGIASNMIVPTGWATINVDLWWTNASSSSGDVLWRVFLDNDADGAALGGGSTPGALAAIAAPTTSAVLKKSTVATGFAVTAGNLLNIAIDRNGNGAGDTLANDAVIVGVNIRRAS